MDFTEKFSKAAVKVVAKFATEIGQSTIRSIASSGYDPELGVVTNDYQDQQALMAFDSIEEINAKMARTEPEETSAVQAERIAFIPGLNVSFAPKKDDLIIAADDSLTYKIVDVTTDMYQALYECRLTLVA